MRTEREDRGITKKVIARMRIVGAGRAMCGSGARKIGADSGSVYGERLGESVQGLLESNRSILQPCKIIYNDDCWRAILIEKGLADHAINFSFQARRYFDRYQMA